MSKKLSVSLFVLSVGLVFGISYGWRNYRNPIFALGYQYEPCQSYEEWLSIQQRPTETAVPTPTPTLVAYPIMPPTAVPETNAYPPYINPTPGPLLLQTPQAPRPWLCTCMADWQKYTYLDVSVLYPVEAFEKELEPGRISLYIPDCKGSGVRGEIAITIRETENFSLENYLQQELDRDSYLRYREITVNQKQGVEIYERSCSYDVEVIFVRGNRTVHIILHGPPVGGKIADFPCWERVLPRPSAEQLGFFYAILDTVEFSTAP